MVTRVQAFLLPVMDINELAEGVCCSTEFYSALQCLSLRFLALTGRKNCHLSPVLDDNIISIASKRHNSRLSSIRLPPLFCHKPHQKTTHGYIPHSIALHLS
jgi:hypothetical protein